MKYKIKNRIIDAKSPVEALKIHKLLDSKCKDEESLEEKIHKAQEWVDFDIKHHGEVSELTKRDIEKMGLKYDKWNNQVTDSEDDDINYLTEEEYQAVEDYRKAITNTTDPKLLKVFAHILKEETEHIEELESEEIHDSESYFVTITYLDNHGLSTLTDHKHFSSFDNADRYCKQEIEKIYNKGYSLNTATITHNNTIVRNYVDDGSNKHYKLDYRFN